MRAAAVGVPAFLRKWPCDPARRRGPRLLRPHLPPRGANKASLCAAERALSVIWGPEAQGRAVTEAGRGPRRRAAGRRASSPGWRPGSPGRSLFLSGSGPASGYCAAGRGQRRQGPGRRRGPSIHCRPAGRGPTRGASGGEPGSAVGRRRRRAGSDPGPAALLLRPPRPVCLRMRKEKANTGLAGSGPLGGGFRGRVPACPARAAALRAGQHAGLRPGPQCAHLRDRHSSPSGRVRAGPARTAGPRAAQLPGGRAGCSGHARPQEGGAGKVSCAEAGTGEAGEPLPVRSVPGLTRTPPAPTAPRKRQKQSWGPEARCTQGP